MSASWLSQTNEAVTRRGVPFFFVAVQLATLAFVPIDPPPSMSTWAQPEPAPARNILRVQPTISVAINTTIVPYPPAWEQPLPLLARAISRTQPDPLSSPLLLISAPPAVSIAWLGQTESGGIPTTRRVPGEDFVYVKPPELETARPIPDVDQAVRATVLLRPTQPSALAIEQFIPGPAPSIAGWWQPEPLAARGIVREANDEFSFVQFIAPLPPPAPPPSISGWVQPEPQPARLLRPTQPVVSSAVKTVVVPYPSAWYQPEPPITHQILRIQGDEPGYALLPFVPLPPAPSIASWWQPEQAPSRVLPRHESDFAFVQFITPTSPASITAWSQPEPVSTHATVRRANDELSFVQFIPPPLQTPIPSSSAWWQPEPMPARVLSRQPGDDFGFAIPFIPSIASWWQPEPSATRAPIRSQSDFAFVQFITPPPPPPPAPNMASWVQPEPASARPFGRTQPPAVVFSGFFTGIVFSPGWYQPEPAAARSLTRVQSSFDFVQFIAPPPPPSIAPSMAGWWNPEPLATRPNRPIQPPELVFAGFVRGTVLISSWIQPEPAATKLLRRNESNYEFVQYIVPPPPPKPPVGWRRQVRHSKFRDMQQRT